MDWRGIGAEVLQAAGRFKYFCWWVQIFFFAKGGCSGLSRKVGQTVSVSLTLVKL